MKMKSLIVALAAMTVAVGATQAQPPREGRRAEGKCPKCECCECRCPECAGPACRLDGPRPAGLTAEQMAQRMTDRMTKRLKLTPEQASQVYPLCLDQAKRVIKARDDRRAGVQPKKNAPEKMKKMREQHVAKMQKILTPEQFTQWLQSPSPKDRPHHPHHKGRKGEMKRAPHERHDHPGAPERPGRPVPPPPVA